MANMDGSKKRAILAVLGKSGNNITKETPIPEIQRLVKKQHGIEVSANYVVVTRKEFFDRPPFMNPRRVEEATPPVTQPLMVSLENVEKIKELVTDNGAAHIRSVATLIDTIGAQSVLTLVDLFAAE